MLLLTHHSPSLSSLFSTTRDSNLPAHQRALRAREAEFGSALRFVQQRLRFLAHFRARRRVAAAVQIAHRAAAARRHWLAMQSAAVVIQV
jgi:hypothetical protein